MIPKSFLLHTDEVIEWLIENLQGGIAHDSQCCIVPKHA
jgi:hypothetical protein